MPREPSALDTRRERPKGAAAEADIHGDLPGGPGRNNERRLGLIAMASKGMVGQPAAPVTSYIITRNERLQHLSIVAVGQRIEG
jgi:hypothetical protein